MVRLRSAALAAAFLLANTGPVHPGEPGQYLVNDLSYVASRLRADHPGFVDEVDPALRQTAGAALTSALQQARLARSEADYARVMQAYAAAFQDPHVSVSLENAADETSASTAPAGALVKLGSRAWKLVLPTFYAGHQAFRSTAEAITAAEAEFKERPPSLIVIDLRGNGGGSSAPADRVLTAIWGEGAPSALNARRPNASLWRTSEGVIQDLRIRRGRIALRYPESLAGFDRLLRGIEVASQRGEPLYRFPLPDSGRSGPLKPGPREVIVVTDSACISACLDFMDRLLEAPNVVHAGEPTGSDTLYTEVQSVALPSGRGVVTIPMQKLEGRRRPANSPYQPTMPISDEAYLNKWLTSRVEAP